MEDRVWLEGHLDEIAGWRQALGRNPAAVQAGSILLGVVRARLAPG
jgi:hypothetical protein